MAPSVSLLYILFTVGFLSKCSTGIPQLELGVHFVEEPRDVIGVKGKSLAIPCKARTNRQRDLSEIKWFHNNQLMDLTGDKRRKIFSNGTLYFTKLIHKRGGYSDQGEYRCVVIWENGSLSSRPAYLRISVVPESFSQQPVGQNVEVGSNVRLSCEIDSNPEIEIEWRQDDRKLPQNLLKYAAISGPGVRGSILYIFNVVPDDSGSYRCTAKNIILNKQRHSSSGVITVLPRVNGRSHKPLTFLSAQRPFSSSSSSFSTNVKVIKEGDNVTLDCVANGSPTPALGWTFLQQGKNKSERVFNVTTTGYNIVEIKNITRYQSGWYTCSAMNLSQKELTTKLIVMTAPEIQEKTETIVFRAAKTVRFRCIAAGNPVPDIYWLKDGLLCNITGRIKHLSSVNESLQLRTSELILSSTVTRDAGIYQCIANNSMGSTWAASRLFLNATKPAPRAPEKVSCESVSSSQIKLTWDVPNNANKIIGFSVHYHLTDDGEEMQKVMAPYSRSTQFDKLLPFTNYTFYVRLYVDSASEFSEKTICQTGEEVPIEAPEKTLKIISPNSIRVSWLPLPKEKARGIINQYKIQWRLNGSPSSRVEEVSGDVMEYTIKGLSPGKKYELRVLGATSKGWPDSDLPWESFEVPLNENSHIPSAPEISLKAINSTVIEVRWNLPNKGSEIDGYKIFYRKQSSNQSELIVVPSDSQHHILTDLDPETLYEVTVLGFTKDGNGESGVSSIRTLSDDESSNEMFFDFSSDPEPPISLEADPVSPATINLSWIPPLMPSVSNKIYYYTVCFNPVQTSRKKNASVTCIKSFENKISVMNLNPYTLYEFKVKSHDVNGKESIFSQTVECYTLEDVPSPVTDIRWKAINKTTVQVTWKEPRQGNGIIRNYTLFYIQDSSLPIEMWDTKVVPSSDFITQLTGLTSNIKYYLIIRASTSAGLGSYGTPKQVLITSPSGAPRDEHVPKASKDKQSDHYIGIMVGLAIGMCCIILCTTCILCRRRCLKRQVSQEFEVTSTRHSNGNDCHRDRELVTKSPETEYFTFLSSDRDRPHGMEIAVQHLDTKGKYPNASANGIKLSLLSEGRSSNCSSGKSNIYITENPRYDPNCSDSPLLSPRTYSPTSRRGSKTIQNFKFNSDSRSPLHTGRRKLSESEVSFMSNNNDSISGSYSKEAKESWNHTDPSDPVQNDGPSLLQMSCADTETLKDEEDKFRGDKEWWNVNSVLMNPEFRFSDLNSFDKVFKRKNGYAVSKHFYNEVNGFADHSSGNGNNDIKNHHQIHSIFKDSKLSLHLISKEITQES